jgi:hypothetical protein
MDKKSLIYIAFGVGAGLVAYHFLCKMKYIRLASSQGGEIIESEESTSGGSIGGGGFGGSIGGGLIGTTTPISRTPIETGSTGIATPSRIVSPTPLIVNVTTSPTTSGTTSGSTSVSPILSPVPTTGLVGSGTTTGGTTTTTPTLTAITNTVSKPSSDISLVTATASRFSGFNGSNNDFEVGEILNDI